MVNLPIEFSDKKVTPFGGMSLMKHFLDSIEIGNKLEQLDLPQGRSCVLMTLCKSSKVFG